MQVERALKVAEDLIRAAPVELDNAAEELARALVHVRVSSIAVEDEEDALEKRRHGALVALLVCAPLSSVVIITAEIFSAHVDISQRLLLLDAMSGILSSSFKPNHSFSSAQSYLIKPSFLIKPSVARKCTRSGGHALKWSRVGSSEADCKFEETVHLDMPFSMPS